MSSHNPPIAPLDGKDIEIARLKQKLATAGQEIDRLRELLRKIRTMIERIVT
jgi:hypothetical protein